MSEEVVVIRRARASDAAARAAVVREAYRSLTLDAFVYFFFHEATLQGVVLCGAVLFIFGGCGPAALGAALAAAAGARAAHEAAAARAAARMARERAGFVAERRGPPRPPAAPPRPFRLVVDLDAAPVPGGQVVGTVSLDSCLDAAGGWLAALCVARAWRRRGLGRALEEAARASRAPRPLHALVSALQPAARALLHAAGWRVGGGYARPLLGAALALPLARLRHDGDAP